MKSSVGKQIRRHLAVAANLEIFVASLKLGLQGRDPRDFPATTELIGQAEKEAAERRREAAGIEEARRRARRRARDEDS